MVDVPIKCVICGANKNPSLMINWDTCKDCGDPWTMGKQVDVSVETVPPDQNQKVLSPIEAATDKIKTAFWAAITLGVLNGGVIVYAFKAKNFALSEMLPALADPIILLVLAFWLLKSKSRPAAILLLSMFLLGKLLLILPILGVNDAGVPSVLARQIIWIAIFGWAFLQGILGTFAFHRLIESGDDFEE